MNAKQICETTGALDSLRDAHRGVWEELARICFPRSSTLFPDFNTGQPDRGRIAENWDGTAMRACNTLATGQASRITPMGARWFMLRPPERLRANSAASNWFARCSDILQAALGQSNFYNRAFECYHSRGAFGIAAMEATSGPKGHGLHYRTFPIGSYSIAENSLDEVNVVHRTYLVSPAQILDQFGKDKNADIPEAVRKKYENAETRHLKSERVTHALFPRSERDPRKNAPQEKPIASVHVHRETETILLNAGFDSMPVAVSRWQTNPMSPYGWAPADYALPEAAQANHQEQMLDVLAELAAYPRVLYPAGMKDEIDFAPLGLTSFDPNAGENAMPKEWLTAGRYDIAKDRAADKKRSIEASFFVDLFTAISRLPADATATHVQAIVSESREMFHPIYSNMVREFHTPILRRSFALLMMQGAFPDPPPAVIERDDVGAFLADPEVEYVSAMALALEQSHLQSLNDILTIALPLAGSDPRWLDPLDPETIIPYLIRSKGLPAEFLRSDEKLAALEQQRQAMQQASMAREAAGAVRDVGGPEQAQKFLNPEP